MKVGFTQNDARVTPDPAKAGIALVLVLGMLSIMVIMGVAFAISMRTERLATAAYVDVVRARHLADAALADILANRLRTELEGRLYPPWEVFALGGAGGADGLMREGGERYVPGALRPAAYAADEMVWQDIRDPVENRLMGQYAFMVVNMSGLLDANVIGEYTRLDGGSPGEIPFSPEYFDEANPASFPNALKSWRDAFVRFETIPELNKLGTNSFGGITGVPPFAVLPTYVNHFTTFSRFPTGYGIDAAGDTVAQPQAFIGGPPDQWDLDQIRDVLQQPPAPPIADIDQFVNLLYDYADESYVPRAISENQEGMTFKRVPMINEIVMSNEVEFVYSGATLDELVLRVFVAIETYFPFPAPPDQPASDFTVSIPVPVLMVGPGSDYAGLANIALISPAPPPLDHEEFDYRVTRFVYESRIPAPDPLPPAMIAILAAFNQNMEVLYGGQPVNRIYPRWPASMDGFFFRLDSLETVSNGNPGLVGDLAAFSTIDPRINWDPSRNSQWRKVTMSLGPNEEGEQNNAILYPNASDERFFMYAAQRPFTNVGEVAYLLYDAEKPWMTVRLLGPDPDQSARIIDRFTLTTNQYVRGLVNINTSFLPPLAAALVEAPISTTPTTGTVGARVSWANAQSLAQDIRTRIQNGPGSLRAMSQLAEIMSIADVRAVIGGDDNKFRVESVIRNSLGTLGVRQNAFTVLLAVRTFPDRMDEGNISDENVAAEQRVVALVWRDPYMTGPLATRSHETFVRQFIWTTFDE